MFLPSANGLPFPNEFPPVPVLRLPLGLGLGDASLGLCGGMVYAALDYYHAGLKPPGEVSGEVLDHLARRQLDSVGVAGGLRVYLRTLCGDRSLLALSLAQYGVIEQLVRHDPVPLMLIKTRSWNPMDQARNHQVLAYAAHEGAIRVYDPNHPGDDDASVVFTGGGLWHTAGGYAVRGYYVTEYTQKSPPG